MALGPARSRVKSGSGLLLPIAFVLAIVAAVRRREAGPGPRVAPLRTQDAVRPTLEEARASLFSAGIAFITANLPTVLGVVGLAGAFMYGTMLRYYDTAVAAAGWPGLDVSLDKTSALARALLAGMVMASLVGTVALVAFATLEAAEATWRAAGYPLLVLVTALICGAAFADPEVDIGVALLAVGVLGAPVWLGAVIGGRLRRRKRSREVKENAVLQPARPLPAGGLLTFAAMGALMLGIVAVTAIGSTDRTAQGDVEAIRNDRGRDVLWRILAPLDIRKVRIAWLRPEVRAAYEPLPADTWLLLGHRDGLTLLVEAFPRPGHVPERLEIPNADVVVRGA